jgi:glutaminase
MTEALEQVRADDSGKVYEHGPYDFQPQHLGATVVLVDGTVIEVGDTQAQVPLMSVSKPFAFAAAIERHGPTFMAGRIGLNATGFPFDAASAPERNPLVNTGAIAVHSYLQDFDTIRFFGKLAGETLVVPEQWRVEPMAITMATAWMMNADGALRGDPEEAAEAYLEACVVRVTPTQVARMGAVLASGGLIPGRRYAVLQRQTVRQVLSVMSTAGMYEDSGEWLADTGMPSKSGVSGIVLAVAPGWGAIVAYSPKLDEAGNSIRGMKMIEILAKQWGLHFVDRGFH